MNKLQGFYELQRLGIPTVPWEEFKDNTKLSDELLWTVRSAVLYGDDFDLPRAIGVDSKTAMIKYKEFYSGLTKNDLVIYYPYFIADKSGVVLFYKDRVIIEACKEDLWNLVTNGKCEVTYEFVNNEKKSIGSSDFLNEEEINELIKYNTLIRKKYKDYLIEGKAVLLEWSFAYKSDINKKPIGERYLVFYECRVAK